MKIYLCLLLSFSWAFQMFGQSYAGQDSSHYWTWEDYYWLHQERNIYVYDELGLISTILRIQRYMGPWDTTYLQTITYDPDGDIINRLFQYWNGSIFTNSRRDVYFYDANKNLIEVLTQNWENPDWHSWARQVMEYDDQDNLITAGYYSWIGSDWIGSHQELYLYDQEDRLMQSISQSWNTVWTNSSQEFYSYNANGDLEITLNQIWWQDDWNTEFRLLNEFSLDNRLLKTTYQRPTFSDWFNQYQWLYTYDSLGNELSQLFQSNAHDEWENESLITKTYDQFQNLIAEAEKEWKVDEWEYTDSTFHYFPFVSGIKDLTSSEFAFIYPNPVRSTLNLQFEEIDLKDPMMDIYSNTGIKVMHINLVDQKTFALDVRKLVAGLYFLRIYLYSHSSYQVIPFLKQ